MLTYGWWLIAVSIPTALLFPSQTNFCMDINLLMVLVFFLVLKSLTVKKQSPRVIILSHYWDRLSVYVYATAFTFVSMLWNDHQFEQSIVNNNPSTMLIPSCFLCKIISAAAVCILPCFSLFSVLFMFTIFTSTWCFALEIMISSCYLCQFLFFFLSLFTFCWSSSRSSNTISDIC